MTGMFLFWLQLICMVKYKAAHEITFFHGSRYAEIVAPDTRNIDFGSTLAYHSGMKSLVVGAPFSDLNGIVYSCPINDHTLETKTTSCNQFPINIEEEVPNYSRSKSPNQHFGLGATISVTPDGIFTCAPLLTLDIITANGTKFGASGTCFTYNGASTSRYFGLYEQHERDMKTKNFTALNTNHFYGGVGWTTLADVDNNLILISKPMPKSVLFLMNMDQPTGAVQTIVEGTEAANAVYKGGAMAYGTFFKSHPRLYAFSVDISRRFGYIAFLLYKNNEKKMELLTFKNSQGRPKSVFVRDNNVGSMFGWALHSAEINGDGFTELVVGAPMYVDSTDGGYECGAVHIYLGGIPLVSEFPKMKKLCIYSVEDASRFGSSVATADIDGDSIPEIFVSAPYEDGGKGTVYIFSGSEVNEILIKMSTVESVTVPISHLIYTQKIRSPDLQSLGFSLQVLPVPNFDKYGQHLLAMGSLDGGKVALYRSIPIITVDVTAEVKGTNVKNKVREQDSIFTVSVTVDIKYPPQLALVTGKIFVSTNIVGDAAWIEKGGNYEIMLAGKPASNVNDVVVSLGDHKREFYMFTATVQSDTENLKRNDFDSSLVDISPQSTTDFEFGIMIACLDDCDPRLSLTFDWSGRNKTHYALGTSTSEIMSVIVHNDGGVTFGSCARIRVTGAQISFLDCKMEEGWYKCDLTDIKRNTELKKPILLDMSKPTNKDRSLTIEAVLYDDCSSNPNEEPYIYTLDYEFNTEVIYFNSTNYNRIITDHEIGNVEVGPNIEINELYTITNNGQISWDSLPLEVHLEEKTFIKDFLIQVNSRECIKDELKLKYNCSVNLQPGSTVNVQSTVTLVKDKIKKSLENGTLKISCHFKMHMIPTLEILENTFLTKIVYKKTIGLENNVYVVTAIAIILGVFVMIIIVILLFKSGFFKRKDKQKLASLKNSIRLHSVRRPTVAGVQYNMIEPQPGQQGEDGTGSNITENRPGEHNVGKRRRKKASQSRTNQEEGDGRRESNFSFL